MLEPGELAADLDRGPTVERRGEAIRVAPIVLLDEHELLERERAAEELGLDPARTTALVNLGQGPEVDAAVSRVLARLAEVPDLQVAALRSSIGAGVALPEGVVPLEATFPMSRYFRAFDLAVSAAGYNAFHELIAFAVPSLFVPMPRQTDDQRLRARWAAHSGAGLAVDGPTDVTLEGQLEELLAAEGRERLAGSCRELFPAGGSAEAASEVEAILAGEGTRKPIPSPDPLRRWLRMSAHPIGPSLPLAGALTARDLLRHPERRRPKALLLAFEVDPAELEQELREAVEWSGLPPGRILAITDHSDLAPFGRLGVGIQRAPAAAELGLSDDDPAYARVLGETVDQALEPWRGTWSAYPIGEWWFRDAGPIPGRTAELELASRIR